MRPYSQKCSLLKYWNETLSKCVSCDLLAGFEVTPNCGLDDSGGMHEGRFNECPSNTFNTGSSATCLPCSLCPPGSFELSPCTTTTDTRCQPDGTETFVTTMSVPGAAPITTHANAALWAVPLAVLSLVVFLVCLVWVKRKRGQTSALDSKRTPHNNHGFFPLSSPASRTLEDTLDPAILSAPMQTILNDLDVLEDLMILLDPETKGLKNTKHLASHCGFSSARITYAYSMRDSKSPLKTVLEGVTSRHPDWTVGDVAKMLKMMERNDAIAVLARLRPYIVEV